MIPVVTLVGRPNVGKSTLFNCLTKTRDALVANFPGLTRDRKYGRAAIAGNKFIVVDTGGIEGHSGSGIEMHIARQMLVAIGEADIVLFIVDARSGLMSADQDIARNLRKRTKVIVLVINKIDGLNPYSATTDFYALGLGQPYPIAASSGRGIRQLIDHALIPLLSKQEQEVKLCAAATNTTYWDKKNTANIKRPHYHESEDSLITKDLPIKLTIVGSPNVGKSTLINRILGEERIVVYDEPGTTRDSIYIPMIRDERQYILVDTAGVRKRGKVTQTVEKLSVIKTLQSIEEANVVLLIIDACIGVSDQDLSLLSLILNNGRPLVIVVNKWDQISETERINIKEMLHLRLSFINFVRIHFISALHGRGIDGLFSSALEAHRSATHRMHASLLTKILKMAATDHRPALVCGRRVKLKYAHAGGYNPPIVVIHGSYVSHLSDSYKRYLISYLRRFLKTTGTPIQIQCKEARNLFSYKRNLSTSQVVKSPMQRLKRK